MKAFDLSGRVAIVTGGNGGIGLGMASGLAAAGARVVIVGRNREKCDAAVASIEAHGGQAFTAIADVTDPDDVTRMVDAVRSAHQRIDILINNAGTNIRKRPEALDYDQWREVLATNIDSAFLCAKACYPALKAAGGGKVLNNGSMLSLFGSPWGPAYGASKGAMVQLTRSLATAWAADNIQVNCFLPGWIDTDLTRQARDDVDGLNEKVLARTPAGRWGVPEDLSGLAVFLASPASDFITGTAIPIDGGFSASLF